MHKKCAWFKEHGKAVITVRYTTGEQKRITLFLCQPCADSVLRNSYARAIVIEEKKNV